MRQRATSVVVIVPVVVAAVAGGGIGVAILALLLAALAGRELEALLAASGRPPLVGGVVAGALILVAIEAVPAALHSRLLGPTPVLPDIAERVASIPGLAAIGLVATGAALAAFSRRDPAEGFGRWSSTVIGAVYLGLLGTLAGLSLAWTTPQTADPDLWLERRWIIVLVAAVWSFDTGAYLVGRAIGRRPFFPWISPRKTAEGVVGGLVAACAGVAIVLALTGDAIGEALVIGPLLGIAAQAGDLGESMLKRAAGAKDSGTLIPGHGGMLDRIDSFLFAAPVLAAYVAIVHG